MKVLRIIGIDLMPGCSIYGKARYSAVILGDDIVEKYENISYRKLIGLIKRKKVDIIALDNIWEIFSDKNQLLKLIQTIGYSPLLVQVTKTKDGELPVEKLAVKHGLWTGGKLSSLQTAEIVAKLARKYVGSYVKIFEDETRIIVCRGRRLGPGGMSSERYKRNINLMIQRITRQIKKTLDKNNIDYDLFISKSNIGFKRSLFIVYVPRERIYGIIKPFKSHDVQIVIKPVVKNEIEFVPLGTSYSSARLMKSGGKPLIVGIDPGIVTGIALLTLDGKPLLVISRRNLSRNAVVKIISDCGKAVLIATDVPKPSQFVRKIAAIFGANIYVPSRPIPIEEKRRLVQTYLKEYSWIDVTDSHQRDALASAIKAYSSFRQKFKRLEEEIRKKLLNVSLTEAKVMVIKGHSIKDIVNEYARKAVKEEEVKVVDIKRRSEETDKAINALLKKLNFQEEIIKSLKIERTQLREQLREIIEENRLLRRKLMLVQSEKYEKIRKTREVLLLEEKINYLEKRLMEKEKDIEQLKSKLALLEEILEKAISGEIVECLKVKTLTKSSFSKLIDNVDKSIIFVEEPGSFDYELVEELIKREIKAVITVESIPEFIKEMFEVNLIPVIDAKNVRYFIYSDKVYVIKENLEDEIRKRQKIIEEKSKREYEEILERIIEDYRRIRAKHLG